MNKYIESRLFELQDEPYRQFQAKLIPGIAPEQIIGVRTPALRRLAKELGKLPDIDLFLTSLPHSYYDEYNLHGFIISEDKDYDRTVQALDALLPYVDNWATCDLLSPKAFKKNRDRLPADINRWINSSAPFTVRFGIEMVMTHFLDQDFTQDWLNRIAEIRSEEYYVNMMIAWFFATALAKHWDATISFLETHRLDEWVHRKTIQKAIESDRITNAQKSYLRTLK